MSSPLVSLLFCCLALACLKVPEVRPGVRCPTGEARITPGFSLPAKFVIHADRLDFKAAAES